MSAGDREAKKSRQVLREQMALVDAIQLPDMEKQKIFMDMLTSAGEVDPEMLQAIGLGPSAMEGISTDPRLKTHQLSALEQLAGVAESGMTPADEAAFELARRNAAQENQAMQGQILQNMQARGQGGSGAELIAKLKTAQSSADAMQAAQLEQAKQQQAARMQALAQVGDLSSGIRSQDFNESAQVAHAKDLINQFNVQNQQSVANANANARNQAQVMNLQNQQNIMNQNTALRNQQQQYNKQLQQQHFNNELNRANARMGVAGQISNSYAQSAANAGALQGQLIGTAATIGGAMIGGPAGAAAGATLAKGAQPSAQQFNQQMDFTQRSGIGQDTSANIDLSRYGSTT
jgi:hypothetical protein